MKPYQPWRQDGIADIWKAGAGGLPEFLGTYQLKHDDGAAPESIPVKKIVYTNGLLVMTGVNHLPAPGDPTLFVPIKMTITDQIEINAPCHGWPNGNGGIKFE